MSGEFKPHPRIGFLLMPNFTLAPFALMQDVLRLAADEGDRSRPVRLEWTVVAPGFAPVRSSSGVEIAPREAMGDPTRFDYVVVCGGLLRRQHGDDEQIETYLKTAHESGAVLVGLCTGSFMLAQAGLLTDRMACISWYHLTEFADEFPAVQARADEMFIFDRDVITCAGGAAAAQVGAWIVRRHLGQAIARKALDILMMESVPGEARPQPRPSALERPVKDERIHRAVLAIYERLDAPPSVDKLAAEAGLSRRQFQRLFRQEIGSTPMAFAASLRVRQADWLMKTSQRSLTEIAFECGYADAAHLSRSYRARFGLPPSQARHAMGYFDGERRPYERDQEAVLSAD